MSRLTASFRFSAQPTSARAVASTSPSFTDPIYSDPLSFVSGMLWAHGTISGLAADTNYYIAAEVNGDISQASVRQMRTPPAGAHSFSFVTASCNRTRGTAFARDEVWQVIRERVIAEGHEFLCHMGDWNYEDLITTDPRDFATLLDGFTMDPAVAEVLEVCLILLIVDDHCWGPDNNARDNPSIPANQIFARGCWPHDPDAVAFAAGSVDWSLVRGRVRFIGMDVRSNREPRGTDPAAVKDMLSPEQVAWFHAEVDAAKAAGQVIIWFMGVPWSSQFNALKDDWGGYAAQRDALAAYIAGEGMINSVLIIHGDMHNVCADLPPNFSPHNSADPIPLFCFAPFDTAGSIKGHDPVSNPYSHPPNEATATENTVSQFGEVYVTDTGGATIAVRGVGRRLTVFTTTHSVILDETVTLTVGGVE